MMLLNSNMYYHIVEIFRVMGLYIADKYGSMKTFIAMKLVNKVLHISLLYTLSQT